MCCRGTIGQCPATVARPALQNAASIAGIAADDRSADLGHPREEKGTHGPIDARLLTAESVLGWCRNPKPSRLQKPQSACDRPALPGSRRMPTFETTLLRVETVQPSL